MSLRAGDIAYGNLDPARGAEQRGTRPVVVISAVPVGPRVIVVPMTTKRRAWPTRIRTVVHGIEGDAMCEQVRAIDNRHQQAFGGSLRIRRPGDARRDPPHRGQAHRRLLTPRA